MFGSMKDMAGLMKQAQQMQAKMAQMQEELARISVDGSAGGGMVKVTLTGRSEMTAVKISPDLIKPEDLEILEDLIAAAYNDAKARLEAIMQDKMKEVTGGLPLPPGMGF